MEEQYNLVDSALQDYKHGIGVLSEKMPTVAEYYNKFTQACFAGGEISEKHKQLMALSIGVVTQDEYCIIYHTKGAVDNGASDQEIMEACGVAAAFGGGAAMSQAVTLVQDCLHEINPTGH